jgi:hypothetical protein
VNLDVQNACRDIRGRKCERGLSLVKFASDGHRRFHGKLNRASFLANFENRALCSVC